MGLPGRGCRGWLERGREGGEGLKLLQLLIQVKMSMSAIRRTAQGSKGKSLVGQGQPISPLSTNPDFSSEHENSLSKKIDEGSDDKVRILQDNLVFVSAIPPEVSSRETLGSPLYFSRYGAVSKLILNPSSAPKKGSLCQAYVTYARDLDAALAIALDGYKLSDRPLKVSFGTTKYCSHFLRGHECPNPDCFYLHRYERRKEVSSGDTRTIFKEQNSKAMSTVLQHIEEMAVRALEGDLQEMQEGFPSISEVLDYLVDNDFVSSAELQRAYESARTKRSNTLQLPKLDVRVQSLADPREREREKQSHKLVKSNSHSTMCTPTKGADEIAHFIKKKEERGDQKDRQIVGKQNAIGTRQLKLQEKIQKLIIKQILKKGNNQCRSRFVKGAVASREECSRLRGIVQKYLIAHN